MTKLTLQCQPPPQAQTRPSILKLFPNTYKPPTLQLVVHITIIRVRNHRLDRLSRLADRALNTVHHTTLSRGRSLLGQRLIPNRALGRGHVGVDAVLAAVLDEVGQVLDGAGAVVVDGAVLGAGGVQLDGGEAGDILGDVVGGGIDLGDGDLVVELGVGDVELSEFLIFGSKPILLVKPGKRGGRPTLCSDRTMEHRTPPRHLSRSSGPHLQSCAPQSPSPGLPVSRGSAPI